MYARREPDPSERAHHLKLTDQYFALLILVFTNAGLCDVIKVTLLSHTRIHSLLLGSYIYARRINYWLKPFTESHAAYGGSSSDGQSCFTPNDCCQNPGMICGDLMEAETDASRRLYPVCLTWLLTTVMANIGLLVLPPCPLSTA